MDFMSFMEIMGTSNIPILAAFFIGLMNAISPCPMATNITAIAYISKKIDNSKHTLLVGTLYTLGRMFTYVILASAIVWFGLNVQIISLSLQKYSDKIIGPFFILLGLVMLNIIKIHLFKKSDKFNNFKEKIAQNGYFGSFMLGSVLALAFCPFSAVLFFGMLIPLALSTSDTILVPAVFAIATGLPVISFSFILVYSTNKIGATINYTKKIERIVRIIIAAIIISIGLYYTLRIFT